MSISSCKDAFRPDSDPLSHTHFWRRRRRRGTSNQDNSDEAGVPLLLCLVPAHMRGGSKEDSWVKRVARFCKLQPSHDGLEPGFILIFRGSSPTLFPLCHDKFFKV